ncbi:MAG: DUF3892 domain-containing protein [Nitrosopumilales archaeon CG_4_10_14_0_8_um_filter_34_8]|nr:MAG: DUF3892 domain-containing protein [Nitrosopumilales archaeon CG_4_10_14_0_8_um_filter_34_8]
MVKWANFVITHVRYNQTETRIIKIKRRSDLGDKLGSPVERTRGQIVTAIGNGYTYVTATYADNKWSKGDRVIRYNLEGEYFIRTDGNKKKSDNLGRLPKF